MKTLKNKLSLAYRATLCLISITCMGCSLSVRSASVPSRPPALETKIFESNWLMGEYSQFSAPKMFLWPTFKIDPQTGESVPMSLAEQGGSRQKIIFSAEKIQFYESAIQEAVGDINQKYNLLLVDLEGAFKKMRCYSYCNPEDFIFCDPEDDSVLFIEDWMTTEDPQINETISLCQDNQLQREGLVADKNNELGSEVTPLREQAAFHAQNFFAELNDNYYTHFARFSFLVADSDPSIVLEFGNLKLSNDSQLPLDRQIVDVQLNSLDGFLSFRSKAFSAEGNTIGEIFYDLELSFNEEGSLSVQGDIRFTQEGKEVRVGRFSSAGTIQ